ncbi:zinc-finger domain-containing protein [Alphaproteobacteria bacterium KMM 3653]|uniref:Zinc-finger domain-containing protein n=1 Tax=Harenicola maris TaxID=2841044 RepID=A0AAP2GAB9_9RHOB|nr:zinc-finger domain-containing protein [Harenicola maris]
MSQDAPEIEVTDKWRVACDGGQGALGHPRVWLSLDRATGEVECGYCDKKFIHSSKADA